MCVLVHVRICACVLVCFRSGGGSNHSGSKEPCLAVAGAVAAWRHWGAKMILHIKTLPQEEDVMKLGIDVGDDTRLFITVVPGVVVFRWSNGDP